MYVIETLLKLATYLSNFYGVLSGDSLEGLVIGSMVGSGLGLAVGVKDAYDGFKSDTVGCGTT